MINQLSPRLQALNEDGPWSRPPVLEFMRSVAGELPAGARVLDVGAGEVPYAELFGHVEYLTNDFEHVFHRGVTPDIVGSADNLPVDDCSFDAVINTQLLEHVPEPTRVLDELYRILRPGGRLFMTVPLIGEVHNAPYDFYRYTNYGLQHMLRNAGFGNIAVIPHTDCFSTLAQLMVAAGSAMGRRPDGLNPQREQTAAMLRNMARSVASLAPLDCQWLMPLNYSVTACRPGRPAEARRFAIAAVALELIQTPGLLAAYAETFAGARDVCLAVLTTATEVAGLTTLVSGVDLKGRGLSLLAVSPDEIGPDSVDALLSARPAPAGLARVRQFSPAELAELRRLSQTMTRCVAETDTNPN